MQDLENRLTQQKEVWPRQGKMQGRRCGSEQAWEAGSPGSVPPLPPSGCGTLGHFPCLCLGFPTEETQMIPKDQPHQAVRLDG